MQKNIDRSRENFIQGISRISSFWGFPKAMGAIYGALYLSPEPVTMDELVSTVGISKGAISTNVKNLERWGMIVRDFKLGDRKDYLRAEIDFWKIIKGILKEREKNEFDLALKKVSESIEMLNEEECSAEDKKLKNFYDGRLEDMKQFFDTLDKMVGLILAFDDLKSLNLKKLLSKRKLK
ncbi:MAG: hypothetical protein GY714_31585 [Desulfobacterales bacterium]|nr:hypothetical protein [Desulfobacterales bacterium]MCP4160375.1 hypothetical protein [Deltaproteobacteria bacterium]